MTSVQRIVAAIGIALSLFGGEAGAVEQDLGRHAANRQPVPILGAGSTFIAPLVERWIGDYQRRHQEARMAYEAVGSGEGVRRFVAGTVDFAASDGGMTDAQIADVDRGVRFIPATIGSVVLAYQLKGVEGNLRLPRDVYAGIFNGTIRRWDDERIESANPGLRLPHEDIALVVRLDGSGTTYAFSNHLSAIDDEWRRTKGAATMIDWPRNAMRARGNEGVAARIRISEGSIGYVEYGFAHRLGLPMAMLQNRAGQFVAPTVPTIAKVFTDTVDAMPADLRLFVPDPAGDGVYPIATYSWLILYGRYPEARQGEALKAFVQYGLTDGQSHALDLGYVPLPAIVANLSLSSLKTVEHPEKN